MNVEEWRRLRQAGLVPRRAPEGEGALGVNIVWDCEHAKTTEGYYQVRGGIEYAIAKSLAAAPLRVRDRDFHFALATPTRPLRAIQPIFLLSGRSSRSGNG